MPILQSYDRDTVNSVFYQILDYNRKNLYLCILLIVIFCMAVKVDIQAPSHKASNIMQP